MVHALRLALLSIALLGTFTSTVYLFLVLAAALRFHLRSRRAETPVSATDLPPLSVLKPVHGAEPRLDKNIASFFSQSYPEYELIFCARHLTDAAMKVVDQVQASTPSRVQARKIECGEPPWVNPKIWSLDALLRAAAHQCIVITDSDVKVGENFLRNVAPPLADPTVGMVTCLYRGVPTGGPWSRLEALGMSVEMSSGVLVADMMEGMQFALGPCMATKKSAIAAIGGVARLADYLADDFVLGNWISRAGLKVALATEIIDHVVTNTAFLPSMRHQVGWARSTRFSRPLGHLGSVLTFAMPFAMLGCVSECLLGNWRLGLGLLAWGIVNRVVQALAVGWGVVKDRESPAWCLLYPLRDLMGFLFWIWGYLSDDVRFRGEIYTLYADGKIRLKHHNRGDVDGTACVS